MKEKMKEKMKVKLPNESIYLVSIHPDYENDTVIAAFKSIKGAENFIKKCMQTIKTTDEIEFIGNKYAYTIDKDNVYSLKITESEITNGPDIPFYNK